MKRVLEWQTGIRQQAMLKPLDELKEEYARKAAEWATTMPSEHHQFLFWQAQDISYEVSMEFAKRTHREKKELGQEPTQEILNEDGYVDNQLLGC